MKKLVKVEEIEGEGLIGLMGQNVLLFCANYIYHGKLEGVNESFVMISDAKIVYETGAFSGPLKDAQKLSSDIWYVQISSIESYGVK